MFKNAWASTKKRYNQAANMARKVSSSVASAYRSSANAARKVSDGYKRYSKAYKEAMKVLRRKDRTSTSRLQALSRKLNKYDKAIRVANYQLKKKKTGKSPSVKVESVRMKLQNQMNKRIQDRVEKIAKKSKKKQKRKTPRRSTRLRKKRALSGGRKHRRRSKSKRKRSPKRRRR